MLEAVKRPNGYWYQAGTINGKRVFESLKLPRNEPKATAQALVARANARILDERVHGTRTSITFAEAALHYMKAKGKAYFENDKSAARQLRILITELGDKRMAEITGADLAGLADKHYPKTKPQSRKRHIYVWANAIYRLNAIAERCELKIFKAPGIRVNKPVEAASEEWIEQFIEAARDAHNGNRLVALVLFLTFTAARISEALRVMPHDIENRGGEVWAHLGTTKNGRPRMVQLHPLVVSALAEVDTKSGQPLFGFADRHSANQAIERVCKRAGLKYLSSHKVGRHAFAKRLLDNGYSLAMVQDAGGWLSMDAVNRNYKHLEKTHAQQVAATVPTKLRQAESTNEKKTAKSAG